MSARSSRVFIRASNELGAFESGVAAALIGAVPAVVLGGAASMGVAVLWACGSRRSAQVDRFGGPPVPDAAKFLGATAE